MITAYFDDSGTHLDSDVVLLAGIFGRENQWTLFEKKWRARLDEAVPGKAPIRRFHRYDCHHSISEFAGWSRTETDFFAKELGDIIFDCMLSGCAVAVSRKDWDRLVTGDLRRATGDPEGGCVRNCFHLTLDWARTVALSQNIAFVFEDRPERKAEYSAIYQIYSDYKQAKLLEVPDLVSLTFADAAKVLPLQAADLIAWEMYQDELYFLNDSRRRNQFHRPFVKRLAESGRFRIISADRRTLEALAVSVNNKTLLQEHPQLKADVERYFEKEKFVARGRKP